MNPRAYAEAVSAAHEAEGTADDTAAFQALRVAVAKRRSGPSFEQEMASLREERDNAVAALEKIRSRSADTLNREIELYKVRGALQQELAAAAVKLERVRGERDAAVAALEKLKVQGERDAAVAALEKLKAETASRQGCAMACTQDVEASAEDREMALLLEKVGKLREERDPAQADLEKNRSVAREMLYEVREALQQELAAAAIKLERVQGERDELRDDLDALREAVDEHLPDYVLDDGSDDEANHLEAIEYAGAEIERFRHLDSVGRGKMTQEEAYRAMAHDLGAERSEPEVAVAALQARLRERPEAQGDRNRAQAAVELLRLGGDQLPERLRAEASRLVAEYDRSTRT